MIEFGEIEVIAIIVRLTKTLMCSWLFVISPTWQLAVFIAWIA